MNYRILAFTLLLSSLFGCDKFAGESITVTFDIVNEYKELHISNAINVVISDTAEEVKVTAGENLIPNIIIEEKGDSLDIRLKDGTYLFNSVVNIELPANSGLTKLNLSMKCQRAKKSLSTLKMDTQIYVAVLTWLTQKKLTLKVSN